MRVYLHIGTDKTGSTSIQGHLVANRDWMKAAGVYLPWTGIGVRNGHAWVLNDLEGQGVEMLSLELSQARADGFRAAVLSWEGMTFYKADDIRKLHATLADYQVTLIVYIREQADIIQSGFLQRLKAQTNKFPMEIYEFPQSKEEKEKSRMLNRPPTRDYYELLQRWQKHMPGVDIVVREYHRKALSGGDVVQDFFEQIGLPLNDEFTRAAKEDNPSLDVESAMAIQGWQDAGLSKAKLDRLSDIIYSRILRDGAETRYFLSEKAVKSIRKHYRASNKRLAKSFMPGSRYPFSHEKACWRTESLEVIRERAREVAGRCEEIDRTPTLLGTARGAQFTDNVALVDGWYEPSRWGAWSKGSASTIRFRLPRKRMPVSCSKLRLRIRGRYFGPNTSTRISINGEDFGEHDLAGNGGTIILPVEKLLPFETMEIKLHHQQPISGSELGRSADKRLLAFGVEKLGCAYLLEHEYKGVMSNMLTVGQEKEAGEQRG